MQFSVYYTDWERVREAYRVGGADGVNALWRRFAELDDEDGDAHDEAPVFEDASEEELHGDSMIFMESVGRLVEKALPALDARERDEIEQVVFSICLTGDHSPAPSDIDYDGIEGAVALLSAERVRRLHAVSQRLSFRNLANAARSVKGAYSDDYVQNEAEFLEYLEGIRRILKRAAESGRGIYTMVC